MAPAQPSADFDQVEGRLDPDVVDQLEATLAEAVRLSGSSGGVAGVWVPWAGAWTAGEGGTRFGKSGDDITADTRFQLAGVTGEITCAIALRLVDADVIELDDEVQSMVRGLPGIGDLTVEQLCRHDSGLADYYSSLRSFFISNPERNWPAGELIASGMARDRVGEPGANWAESRTGMLLLATALEQVTGRSWTELAEQYVLDPLDMDATVMPDPADTDQPDALGGYASQLKGDGTPDCEAVRDVSDRSSSISGPAGGAWSSLDDAREFSQAFASGTLFSEGTARRAWTVEPFGGTAPSWQGQGIGGQEYGPLRGIAGESVGALTAVFTDPDTGLTVVLALDNSTGGATLVREAAFALASIGSKAAAVDGRDQPLVELPWSLEQATQRMTDAAPCPLPAEGDGSTGEGDAAAG
ncbi:serine hydrolase domain-containing protein [Agromyces aurantiacus]|uniref:Serine hydrolase domain-containing protein n=1 Tax=Agromyces aurantiacus TaxID=165814 RepID=A0ABV9R2U6_9MICO|nr:serine hydrolase domain-containing protein [Agromyces aurantiacus]MBM7502825.1 D-alanyl-D-alanine carboxypeptidase [Agromyces aurantiacus]